MCDAHNEEVRAEIRSIAADYVSCQRGHQKPGNHIHHIHTIYEIHEQSQSMVLMLLANLRLASESGEVVSNSGLECYASQLQSNMNRAIEASRALGESLK
jgi:hypothetical protein